MKSIGGAVVFGVLCSSLLWGDCYTFSCNGTIRYAMGRYSDKTIQRLNDYKKTITASKWIEDLYFKILTKQNKELDKMLARSTLENLDIKAIKHYVNRKEHLSKRYNTKTTKHTKVK